MPVLNAATRSVGPLILMSDAKHFDAPKPNGTKKCPKIRQQLLTSKSSEPSKYLIFSE
jgi:hypothetical protein